MEDAGRRRRVRGESPLAESGKNTGQSRLHLIQRAASPKSFHCPDFAGDAKPEACLNDRDRLRPSEKGPSVEKVQRALLHNDIFIGPEGADGKFGPNTAQGVMTFKAKHHLGFTEFPDVGPGTMSKRTVRRGFASAPGLQIHRPLWE